MIQIKIEYIRFIVPSLCFVVCLGCFSCKKNTKHTSINSIEEIVMVVPEDSIRNEEDDINSRNAAEVEKSSFMNRQRATGNYWLDIPVAEIFHFTGKIDDKYAFDMYLTLDSSKVDGFYNYLKHDESISLTGTLVGNKLEIKEKGDNRFDGYFNYNTGIISGTWYSGDGKRILPFEMHNPFGKGYPRKEYKVHIEDDGEGRTFVTSIKITNKADDRECVLELDDIWAFYAAYYLYIEDYNFDGYQDISMFRQMPAYPPLRYAFLFYNSDTECYEQTDALDDIYTLPCGSNFRNKIVYQYIEGRHYNEGEYKYINGNYFLIKNSWYRFNENEDGDFITEYYKYNDDNESIKISEKEYKQLYFNKED